MHQTPLMQKDATGLEALLRDDKKDELARLYRLYKRLPTGLLLPGETHCLCRLFPLPS